MESSAESPDQGGQRRIGRLTPLLALLTCFNLVMIGVMGVVALTLLNSSEQNPPASLEAKDSGVIISPPAGQLVAVGGEPSWLTSGVSANSDSTAAIEWLPPEG